MESCKHFSQLDYTSLMHSCSIFFHAQQRRESLCDNIPKCSHPTRPSRQLSMQSSGTITTRKLLVISLARIRQRIRSLLLSSLLDMLNLSYLDPRINPHLRLGLWSVRSGNSPVLVAWCSYLLHTRLAATLFIS